MNKLTKKTDTKKYTNRPKQKTPHSVLKKYFGYSEFREGQLEIIQQIVASKDCLAILPTGGGKSLCFQIPGILFSGVTVVISPLISLMKDQVDTLNSKGISACYISSLLEKKQLETTYELLNLNTYKFLYISPERLQSKRFQKCITQLKISQIVIDEAHCISQWGNDFRPAYKEISKTLKKILQTKTNTKKIPIVAFTATANQNVQSDICQSLELHSPFIYYKSFKRTNLSIEVIHCFNTTIKNIVLMRLLQKHQDQVGIIYCATRKTTEQLATYLTKFGFNCEYYHGGLENTQKKQVQLSFCSGYTKIIIATNAFGMGIDVQNIRFVIHYQIPGNIENYYQEIGRAGRDQKPSWCYTFFCPSDVTVQYELLKKFPQKIREFEKMKQLVLMNSCRTKKVLHYFGEVSNECNNCDICDKNLDSPQLQIKISSTEIELIKKLLVLREKSNTINRQFPITDTHIAFLALLKPKTRTDFLKIPGIGTGFISVWFELIQPILA